MLEYSDVTTSRALKEEAGASSNIFSVEEDRPAPWGADAHHTVELGCAALEEMHGHPWVPVRRP